jgi:hypothetical protein
VDGLHGVRPIADGDVVDLECRRGRQHDVGVASSVGEHLLVHHREDVVA